MASSEELGCSTTANPDHDDHARPHSDPYSLLETIRHLNLREEEEEEEAVEEDHDENESDNEKEREKENERDSGRKSEGERERDRYELGEERQRENGGEEREFGHFGYENNDDINTNYINKSKDRFGYPVRPEAEDCAFYIKTGTCKYGLHCKYNHPVRRKNSFAREKVRDREDSIDKASQIECKYYSRTGGCKFGKACRYNHNRAKTSVVPAPELNFLGLPIRPGEKECPYYMRTGSCKFVAGCRFNHPDPTAVGGNDLATAYADDGWASLQNAFQPTAASWSTPGTLKEVASGPQSVPIVYPLSPGVPSQITEWKSYEVPLYPSERGMQPPPFGLKGSATESTVYKNNEPHILTNEYPDRPGQPECSYYLKTGDCKFKSYCKYHHPKNRIQISTPVVLSDKGLPLRPDQSTCSYYSQYGICKFGPACKFNHPIHWTSLNMSGLDDPRFGNSTGKDGH